MVVSVTTVENLDTLLETARRVLASPVSQTVMLDASSVEQEIIEHVIVHVVTVEEADPDATTATRLAIWHVIVALQAKNNLALDEECGFPATRGVTKFTQSEIR